MPEEEILLEFQAVYLYVYHGILTDIDEISSNGIYKIPKDVDEKLDSEQFKEILAKFESKVVIINERISSRFLYKDLQETATANGTIKTKSINGIEVFDSYTKKDTDKWIIIIFDNFQKITTTKGSSLRESIIEASLFLDNARLKYKFVVCAIQQINRNSKSFDRYKYDSYYPAEQDLKDSESPFHDCQVCIVQISPFKLNLPSIDGYDITQTKNGLKDRFRAIKVIKNRGGQAYGVNYLKFIGENSVYTEIPYPEKLTPDFYQKTNQLKKAGDK